MTPAFGVFTGSSENPSPCGQQETKRPEAVAPAPASLIDNPGRNIDMKDHTTSLSPLAIVTGTIATSGALALLLQDALTSGVWKLEHGLIPILMGVQIFTSHLFTAACVQRRAIPALGFLVVTIASTWGVLYTSVGKQSAVQADASLAQKALEGRRAPIEKMLADAQYMLADCPAGTPAKAIGNTCSLKAAMVAECKSGKGKRCDGLAYSVQTYEAAIKGYTKDLNEMGAPKSTDARASTMAKVISKLRGSDEESVREMLILIEPFTYATIFELAALVSFGFAFGYRKKSATQQPSPAETMQTSFALPATEATIARQLITGEPSNSGNRGNGGGNGGLKVYTREEAEADLVTRLALGETVAAQDELAGRWGVHKATVSKWLKSWEGDGLIPARRRVGRTMQLAAAE